MTIEGVECIEASHQQNTFGADLPLLHTTGDNQDIHEILFENMQDCLCNNFSIGLTNANWSNYGILDKGYQLRVKERLQSTQIGK